MVQGKIKNGIYLKFHAIDFVAYQGLALKRIHAAKKVYWESIFCVEKKNN